ncbi:hypothetical protein [Deinococcus aquatilis]|uniref:hypothetical protein n=1 Tax=Deinococcus aquatilis TaxID=519440 RepID=UPI000364CBE7|nr:hypothetical protein [Deinococcus aquatilis]
MKHLSVLGLLTLAGLLNVTGNATSANPTATPTVQGTTQLSGQNASVGQTFTIGKTSPLNFTLTSAEYSVGRLEIGSNVWLPKANEKLLILRFTIQNPQAREVGYYWGDVKFTAVDAQDRNYEGASAIARSGTTEALRVTLKPAQKVDVTTVLVVPAAGSIPKLIVQRSTDSGVLRYALNGSVKGLTAPFADPTDLSGATALETVPVTPGTFVPLGEYDVRLDTLETTGDLIQNKSPKAGYTFFTAVFTLKNPLKRPINYYWGNFDATLRDTDGDTVAYNKVMLKATKDESATGTLRPGENARIRFYFEIADGVQADQIMLNDRRARTYAFSARPENPSVR